MISGALRSRRVVLDGPPEPATVIFDEGKIVEIAPWETDSVAPHLAPHLAPHPVDLGDLVLFPGLVDTHVHINEPGRTEWEGFATATRAAAAGGITTLVDMPLNSTPTTVTPKAVATKAQASRGQLAVDVGFWGGLVPASARPEALRELAAAGVLGFKAFLVDSGIDDFPPVGESHLRAALPTLAELGLPLLAHAELPGPIEAATAGRAGDPRSYATYLATRPDAAEVEAVRLLLRLCRERPFPLHIVHVASAEVLPLLAAARREGLPVTAETCPHYLTFTAEEIADGATAFKCAPPIRGAATREALWEALREGVLDLAATDHSPAPPGIKKMESSDFLRAWGGIASLQLLLPAVWTEARRRGFAVQDLVPWLCWNPARLAGLGDLGLRKGRIAVGYDADFVAWDPEGRFTVDPQRLEHRHPITPYAGRTLQGQIAGTWLGGQRIYDGATLSPLRGQWRRRP
jgi:allantoinase